MYAEFEPARYQDRPMASSLYIIFRFFDRLKYPVSIWPPDLNGSIDFPFEYVRVEPVPYLDSLINPPYPQNINRGLIKNDFIMQFNEPVKIRIKIDTTGKVSGADIRTRLDKNIGEKIIRSVKSIKFTPARDINDQILEYSADIFISKEDDRFLRIVFPWLPEEISWLAPVSD